MEMWVPMQQLSVSLDGRDHAGHEVVTAQVAPDFFLDAGPCAVNWQILALFPASIVDSA